MFGSSLKPVLGDVAFMASTLARDFIGLESDVAAGRITGVWHGSEIAVKEDGLLVVHQRFPDFNFHFVLDQPDREKVDGLLVQGINDFSGLWLFCTQVEVASRLRPSGPGKLGKYAKKSAQLLERHFGVRHEVSK